MSRPKAFLKAEKAKKKHAQNEVICTYQALQVSPHVLTALLCRPPKLRMTSWQVRSWPTLTPLAGPTLSPSRTEGVGFEEAGEKWRAGDAAKSMRFFNRAHDMYSQGLQKFPENLDLAYNKSVNIFLHCSPLSHLSTA